MDNYNYRLEYTNNDTKVVHTFPADITLFELCYFLRDFLAGCSWKENQIKDILKLEGDDNNV